MTIQTRINILVQYKDKCYVYSQMCNSTYEFFSFLRSIINIPLIIISSLMAILNSGSFSSEDMKLPNIVINSVTALILSLISNFKLAEKDSEFKKVSILFTKLLHKIEDDLNNNLQTLTREKIQSHILEYDTIVENIDYTIPTFIKKRYINLYKSHRSLPNILNCVSTDGFTRTESNLTVIEESTV